MANLSSILKGVPDVIDSSVFNPNYASIPNQTPVPTVWQIMNKWTTPQPQTQNFMGYDLTVNPDWKTYFESKQDWRIRMFNSPDDAKQIIQAEANKQENNVSSTAQPQQQLPQTQQPQNSTTPRFWINGVSTIQQFNPDNWTNFSPETTQGIQQNAWQLKEPTSTEVPTNPTQNPENTQDNSIIPTANADNLDEDKIKQFIQAGKDAWASENEIQQAFVKAGQDWVFNKDQTTKQDFTKMHIPEAPTFWLDTSKEWVATTLWLATNLAKVIANIPSDIWNTAAWAANIVWWLATHPIDTIGNVIGWIKQGAQTVWKALETWDLSQINQTIGQHPIQSILWAEWTASLLDAATNIIKNPSMASDFISQLPQNVIDTVKNSPDILKEGVWAVKDALQAGYQWPWSWMDIWETIKNISNKTATDILSKQWKLSKPIRRDLSNNVGMDWAQFALENDLVWPDIESTADNAWAFKLQKIQEKLDAVKNFWDIETPDVAKNVATVLKNDIIKQVTKSYWEDADIWKVLNDNSPDIKWVYDLTNDIINSNKVSYVQLEQLKELHDYLNPEGIEYDLQGKPKSEVWNLLAAGKRQKLQSLLEDAGTKNWVDIKGINKQIQWAYSLEKWLNDTVSRRSNLNMFWLWDTQTAIISSILWGAPWTIWWILLRKWLTSEWFVWWLAKKLYTKEPTNEISPTIDNNVSNTAPKSRLTRILDNGGNISNFETIKPKTNFNKNDSNISSNSSSMDNIKPWKVTVKDIIKKGWKTK